MVQCVFNPLIDLHVHVDCIYTKFSAILNKYVLARQF